MATPKYNTKGSSKQDLINARQELKQFRKDVSALKKKGLIDKARYDARKVLNTGGTGKYLKSQIKKFANVLSGAAQPVKVSKSKEKYYREKGYTVKSGRVIVPVEKNETAYSAHGDIRVTTKGTNGKITKIDLGLDRNSVLNWADQLRNKKIKLKENESLAFQFFGNNSYRSFPSLKKMIEYLEYYETFQTVSKLDNPDKEQELIDNIVIFRIERGAGRPPPHSVLKEHSLDYKDKISRRNQERYLRRLNLMTPEQENKYHEKRAERERQRRQELKADPIKYASYKEKANERRKKSEANKRAKKNAQKD